MYCPKNSFTYFFQPGLWMLNQCVRGKRWIIQLLDEGFWEEYGQLAGLFILDFWRTFLLGSIPPSTLIVFIGATTQLQCVLWKRKEFGFLTGEKEKIISFNSVLAVFHVFVPRHPRQPHLRAKQTGWSYLEKLGFLCFEYNRVWAHKTLMSSLKVVGLSFLCLNSMTRNLELAMNARLFDSSLSLYEKSWKLLWVPYVPDVFSAFFLCCFLTWRYTLLTLHFRYTF